MIRLLLLLVLLSGCIGKPKYIKNAASFSESGLSFKLPAVKCEYSGFNSYILSFDEYQFPLDEIMVINLNNLNEDEKSKLEFGKILTISKYYQAKYEVLYIKNGDDLLMLQYRLGSTDLNKKFVRTSTDKGYQVWRSFCNNLLNSDH